MFQPLTLFNRGRRAPSVERASDDPFYRLQHEMNRLFDDAFAAPTAWRGSAFSGDVSPSVDLRETDDAIEIDVELPGVEEKDIDVQISDSTLTIRGEKKFEKREEGKNGGYHYFERSYGSFSRSIPLPVEIDADRVEAVFRNGVLKLTLPKPPEAQRRARRIEIRKG